VGAQAQKRAAAIKKKEAELEKLNSQLKADLAQSAIDIAGIADPTPISDVIGAGFSLWRGDFIGAGLSLISVVPYAGDALGKTAKGARLAKSIAGLRKKIATAIAGINKLKKQGREYASAAIRARKKAKKAGEKVNQKLCKKCMDDFDEALETSFGTRAPRGGFKGTRGNSDWVPDSSSSYGKKVLDWQKKNGSKYGVKPGEAITFKNGFPDFSKYVYKMPNGDKAQVAIKVTGKHGDDVAAANKAMKKLDPNWKGEPKNWTWHHNEDGMTMQLIPTKVNSVPHDGGAMLTRNIPGY